MSANDDSELEVLEGLEGARRRPAMYVGDTTDGSGLHHLIFEVVGNVVDLHLARYATELHVEITTDSWITARDDGPGISVALHPVTNLTLLETVLCHLHCGETFDGHRPHVHLSQNLNGVGLAPVNALSARLEVETTRAGVRWAQAYERGEPVSELHCLGPTSIEGTAIRFQPDPEIFGSIELDLTLVSERLQLVARLNPLLRVFFQEHRLAGRGGIRTWVEQLAAERGTVDAVYSMAETCDGVFVDVALAWCSSPDHAVRCFVNMHETLSGTHLDGLWQGLSAFARTLGSAEDVRDVLAPGLVAILHVGLYAPRFGGPRRDHLTSPAAAPAVARVVETSLPDAMRRNYQLQQRLRARLRVPKR